MSGGTYQPHTSKESIGDGSSRGRKRLPAGQREWTSLISACEVHRTVGVHLQCMRSKLAIYSTAAMAGYLRLMMIATKYS